MGTNYYYRDGTHVAKTSSLGPGRFRIYWAVDPADVARDLRKGNPERQEVIDEYGRVVSLHDFVDMAYTGEQDGSFIGEEFS